MATEAAWLHKEQTHGKKKEKLCLDINRPSHGRTYRSKTDGSSRRNWSAALVTPKTELW
jgi:hypothetical protein